MGQGGNGGQGGHPVKCRGEPGVCPESIGEEHQVSLKNFFNEKSKTKKPKMMYFPFAFLTSLREIYS
jgi:hypothetical protein